MPANLSTEIRLRNTWHTNHQSNGLTNRILWNWQTQTLGRTFFRAPIASVNSFSWLLVSITIKWIKKNLSPLKKKSFPHLFFFVFSPEAMWRKNFHKSFTFINESIKYFWGQRLKSTSRFMSRGEGGGVWSQYKEEEKNYHRKKSLGQEMAKIAWRTFQTMPKSLSQSPCPKNKQQEEEEKIEKRWKIVDQRKALNLWETKVN